MNLSRLASEFGLCHHTVRACFDLLECTLVGGWVPGCHKHRKRRLRLGPKFYFSDVGTVDRLLRRGELSPGTEGFGQAFENSVLNEIGSFASHQEIDADVTHWRLPGGIDIGFVLGAMLLAIEVKCSERIANRHLKGLRTLAKEHPEARRGVVVCREATAWPTEDGIEGLPARTFATRLWRGELACLVQDEGLSPRLVVLRRRTAGGEQRPRSPDCGDNTPIDANQRTWALRLGRAAFHRQLPPCEPRLDPRARASAGKNGRSQG